MCFLDCQQKSNKHMDFLGFQQKTRTHTSAEIQINMEAQNLQNFLVCPLVLDILDFF